MLMLHIIMAMGGDLARLSGMTARLYSMRMTMDLRD